MTRSATLTALLAARAANPPDPAAIRLDEWALSGSVAGGGATVEIRNR